MFTKEQRDADIHTLSAVNLKLGADQSIRSAKLLEFQFVEDGTHKVPIATVQHTIVTWVIRVSGTAIDQKRTVRPTDIEALKLLLTTKQLFLN